MSLISRFLSIPLPRFGSSRRLAAGAASAILLAAGATVRADETPAPSPTTVEGSLLTDGWSVHEQATVIEQWHYGFPSPYEGPNSLSDAPDAERTFSSSLFLDRQLWPGAELVYNPEFVQGHGLSDTLGVAGYPNGEAAKSGFPNLHYNTSRLFFRQVIGLGGEQEKLGDDVNQCAEQVDIDRLTLSAGKFSAADIFDDNAYSHDPRTQFLNGAMWESAAWDYPADALGYTGGFAAEWNTQRGTLNYGIFMEPSEANGPRLDHHPAKANGQILEYDVRYTWSGHAGTVRPFVYWNRAHMGSYAIANSQPAPEDITTTESYRSKTGLGVSWDQELTSAFGVFTRLSWDDGRTESFSFTEIDRSVSTGISLKGIFWGRGNDTFGLAGAVNGLSHEHSTFLARGGVGIVLGDGTLTYAPEQILETYYDVQIRSWLWLTPDFQYVEHPGYNSDRGGVAIYAVRVHVAF